MNVNTFAQTFVHNLCGPGELGGHVGDQLMTTLASGQVSQIPTSGQIPPSLFEDEARQTLSQVRRAVHLLVEALPGPIRRAADLQRGLGIDKVLAWQVFRLWSAPDPFQAAAFVPTPVPLARALKAGSDRGVSRAVIEGVAAACEEFESLVERHAGDRGSFESMILGVSPGPGSSTIKDRRAAFRASSRLWGIAAHTQIACGIFHAGTKGTDSALITGYVGVRRLRPGVRLQVSTRSRTIDEPRAGSPGSPADRAGSGGHAHPDGVDLLESFCTRPLPSFVTHESPRGGLTTSLEFSGVGRSSSVTYFLRRIVPDWPALTDDRYGMGATTRVPTEALILDMLVPAGRTDPLTAQAGVYGNLFDVEHPSRVNEANRLPFTETQAHLGRSIDSLRTPDFPTYPEMVESVLRGLGWQDTRFDIYRCRVQYPILHACVSAGVTALAREQRAQA